MAASSRPDARPDGEHRLFLALWPDDEVRAALVRAADAVACFRGDGRRVDAARLHVTLHFLGGWPVFPDDIVEQVRKAAPSVDARAFHLVVDHAGSFRGARVGWLAPAGNSGLDALWSALGHALDAARVPRRWHERFAPHVTVLRSMTRAIDEVPVPAVSWPVQDFVLVHSHEGRYELLDRWPLESA